jgi:NADH:ubiquinone oxidoreductase subunit 2 (subunit N)
MPLSAILTIVNFILRSGIYLGLGVSVAIGLRQSSFLGVWVRLELNILLFVALLRFRKSGLEVVRIKYFIVQRIGSTLFLRSVGIATFIGVREALIRLIRLALFLKLGVAPFHGWFIRVISDIRWDFFFLASTVQKVLPLYLISILSSGLLALVVVLRSLVRVLGSLNQLLIKKLLAYSSVFSSA